VVTVGRTVTLPAHPSVPRGHSRVGGSDLLVMQRAILLIDDLGADLDRQVAAERSADERVRLLREATARITRAANDAIQAYRRGSRAVDAQLRSAKGAQEEALAMQASLQAARQHLLGALEVAGRRYPWAGDLTPPAARGPRTTGPERR
jgi:regulator of protease activity HflC (stomatin/prohibitin superfamily)